MQVNFIGHGLDITNENTVGNILATSFEKGKFDCFTAFVAFASIAGVRKLVSSINKNRDNFKHITFYIGIDQEGTSKDALQCLIDNELETYIFHTTSAIIFHPKIYLFEGVNWISVIIGSTNLTNSGLFLNVEAAVSMDFRRSDAQGKKLVVQIKGYFKTLLDKSDRNIQRLNTDLLNKLCLSGLVAEEKNFNPDSNGSLTNNEIEIFPDRDKLDVNEIDFGNAELPDELINSRNYDLQFTNNDAEKFPYFFQKWQEYKLNNPSIGGLVHRETEDRALYSWYRKIKYLTNKQKEIPLQFMQQLEVGNFPFENGGLVHSRIRWNERFEELVAYMKKHNLTYAHVPQHKSNKHPYHSLGQWCAQQKQRRKGNQTPIWTNYEEQKMESINFKWEMPFLGVGQTDDDLWLENYFKLEYFKKIHGHANPSQMNKNQEIKKLGKWVNDQRTLKNTGRTNKKGITKFLSQEKDALLTELGVDWQHQLTKRKEELEKFIREYLNFIKIYPDGKPQKGDRRFGWVMQKKNEIKHRYRDENLEDSEWRRKRLREVGINFW